MAKKSMLFVLLAFVLLISASAVLADQEGTACWCNVDEYGCWNTGDHGEKEYCMFWSEDARTLFMGPDSKAVVTPRPEGGKLALKGHFWFDRYDMNYWTCKQDSTYISGGWKCKGAGGETIYRGPKFAD